TEGFDTADLQRGEGVTGGPGVTRRWRPRHRLEPHEAPWSPPSLGGSIEHHWGIGSLDVRRRQGGTADFPTPRPDPLPIDMLRLAMWTGRRRGGFRHACAGEAPPAKVANLAHLPHGG